MTTRMAWAWDDIEYTPARRDSLRYSEDQPRDTDGRFGSGGGDSAKESAAGGTNSSVALMLGSVPTADSHTAEGQAAIAEWAAQNAGAGSAAYQDMVSAWTGEDAGMISRLSAEPDIGAKSAANPQNDIERQAAEMSRFMDAAPTMVEPLYRGASAVDLSPGYEFQLNPSSFSRDAGIATDHAILGESHPTVIEVQGGARGLPVDGLSKFPEEHEVISGGKFQVVSSEHLTQEIYGRATDYQHLVVRQMS